VVALNIPSSDPVHKATIIPRGRALGMVMRLPERDHLSVSREKMLGDIAVLMGGRIAEELIFGYDKVTSGASSDIDVATKMARAMVTRYGLSDALGPLAYAENEGEVFLGHSVTRQQNVSEDTARKIDHEVRRIVEASYAVAKKILTEQLEALKLVANGLLEYETLTGEEIKLLMRGEPLSRPEQDVPAPQSPATTVPVTGRPLKGAGGAVDGLAPQPQGS